MKIDIKYQEVDLRDVLGFFAEAYTFNDGSKLCSHEAFVDTAKGRVVFKLIIKSADDVDFVVTPSP